MPEFGDGQGEGPPLDGEKPLAATVGVSGPFVRAALMGLGANHSGHTGFQQVMKTPAHDLRNLGANG